ncbi:hypothetical protein [Clostridium cochlearium]|uniref:hypothetical protein n=1 Tax=Clostridium cochlearium TaxID=1494 RepID=UPI001C0ECCC7|nr:hypothetical protein [Clostridium cochlearium]MBU5269477.1 hypothetical protein [Clostridium cochlearium]
MTMLSAVSVPEGIVLSADSSVSGGNNYTDKIFADNTNNIAFMIYNNAMNFYNFQVKYSHPNSTLYKSNEKRILQSTSEYKNNNTPKKFLEHMIKKNELNMSFSSDWTGVVVAGYEDDIPKLYTFVTSKGETKYNPQGSDKTRYYIIPSSSGKKSYNIYEDIIKVEQNNREDKEIKLHCFEKYFGICFSTVNHISDLYGGLTPNKVDFKCFEKMSIQDAEDYSRFLIEYTIKQMKEEGNKDVDYPIDTLIITKDGIRWERGNKSNNNDSVKFYSGNLNI